MDSSALKRLLPTMPMLAESLREAGWNCEMVLSEEKQNYRGIRLYHPRQTLHRDVLYLLRPEERGFPADEYSYLSSSDHPGKANHLILPEYPDEEILDQLLEIFSQFHDWEEAIDLLLYRGAGLQELCELGARFLENPVCIHDDWFVMTAMSSEFSLVMEPEYLLSSARGFVPRAVVEDFQYDSDYLETYQFHDARIWYTPEKNYYTMYVNLWDGPVYKGRMLISRKNRDFRCRDYLLAEVLTQRAVMLLQRKTLGSVEIQQSMDDIVYALLQGKPKDFQDLNHLLSMLRWQKQDRFLCLRIRNQRKIQDKVAQHILHSDLFRHFQDSYILMDHQEQCVILNLTRNRSTPGQIRHQLAPLCRDYCLYGGISSPVSGILELQAAYFQAGIALDSAFRLQGEKWILLFSECALDFLEQTITSPLTARHLVSPELSALQVYDRENGTLYFETLRQYLLLERDIPKTSEKLIIHRTTLLYRLKKIQSLVHLNLEDPWQRLYLMLSLWILEKEPEAGR